MKFKCEFTSYQNTGGSIGHWTIHNIRVSRDPSYICSTPKDIVFMVVKSISKEKRHEIRKIARNTFKPSMKPPRKSSKVTLHDYNSSFVNDK